MLCIEAATASYLSRTAFCVNIAYDVIRSTILTNLSTDQIWHTIGVPVGHVLHPTVVRQSWMPPQGKMILVFYLKVELASPWSCCICSNSLLQFRGC